MGGISGGAQDARGFAFSASATLARLAQAMLGLGSVLLLVQLGRSFAVAGLVGGAISLAQCVGPQVSRLVDAHGQRAVVLPQVFVHVSAVGSLLAAAVADAAAWLLVCLALLVGASLPQAGALARARWTALLNDRAQLEQALAHESLVEEAVFVVGPVLVTALATTVAPVAGVLTALTLTVVGVGTLLLQRRTEPASHRTVEVVTERSGQGPTAAPRGSVLIGTGLGVLVGTFAAIGLMFGLIEVGIVALTRHVNAPGSAGVMLGMWAAGSLVAGAFYGTQTWRSAAVTRFRAGALAMAVGAIFIAGASASTSLLATTAALVVAGTANAPTLITGNTLVPLVVPARRVTEAYTWLGVSVFAGIAVGAALGGTIVDRLGPSACLWSAAVAGALVAGPPLLATRRRVATRE